MGLFGKKKEETPAVPALPELPTLPELPKMPGEDTIPQLPTLPNTSMGDQFSQNSIKDAISGKKEDDEVSADEFEPSVQTMPRKPRLTREMAGEIPPGFKEAAQKVKAAEPIFIRIDKFEDAMKTFEKTKTQIAEIEKILQDTKKIKEEEEKELQDWEEEIRTIKAEIEKIDQDVFSKIE